MAKEMDNLFPPIFAIFDIHVHTYTNFRNNIFFTNIILKNNVYIHFCNLKMKKDSPVHAAFIKLFVFNFLY